MALAVDYDGTLATHGQVPDEVVPWLRLLNDSGRKLILVTGRELGDLGRIFPHLTLFARVVAENGAIVYDPADNSERTLADAPPAELLAALRERNVQPLSVGRVLLATTADQRAPILDAVAEVGLEYQLAFNKGSLMVLPSSVNKRSGLLAALRELRLSEHNVVGIGDAENDHALLETCECAVAVANALPALKRRADLVTRGAHGAGVVELIEALVHDDLASLEPRLKRHWILLGTDAGKSAGLAVPPYGTRLLISGSPKSGKSSLVLGLVERVQQQGYQVCLIDPEGDYEALPNAVNLGNTRQAPAAQDVLDVLEDPGQNVCVSLLALSGEERPRYFAELVGGLAGLYMQTGRPHWLIVDEAHHVLPASVSDPLTWNPGGLALVTIGPQRLSPGIGGLVTHVLAAGKDPQSTMAAMAELLGDPVPAGHKGDLHKGEGVLWRRGKKRTQLLKLARAATKRRRHRRKYAEGELPPERSFYFRGPHGALNLRAQNLSMFVQLGVGVDEGTWMHHLRAGDYSHWIDDSLKDRKLAKAVAALERNERLGPTESREQVKKLIEERYAPPA
jgi:hydroxymethylpyrimidine pyrophosphatase-like HAD family hydrolase